MTFEMKMLPGQRPYAEGEMIALKLLMDAWIDEEENGGLEVGSWEWMEGERRLDEANDERRRKGW